MTVQFILGRSGSGKTYHCLESIRGHLAQCVTGCPLVFLVPEQTTFQMEQSLLAGGDIKGYHRAEIMSFARLGRMVLQTSGVTSLKPLSEFGKQMILRRLLQEHKEEFTLFKQIALDNGFVRALSTIIRELRQYQKNPQQLYQQRDKFINSNDPILLNLADKLSELGLITEAYQKYIAGKFIDPDDFLDLIIENYHQAKPLNDASLWIDGFAGFTPQQYNVLAVLFESAAKTHITLCMDPADPQFKTAQNPANQLDVMNLFHPTLQTYQRLKTIIDNKAITLNENIILPANKQIMPRFSKAEKLTQLEKNLFSATPPHRLTETPSLKSRSELVVIEAAGRRCEVQAVAREILKLVRWENYRFREITIILRQFGDYQELLENALNEHGIPYFIDVRRPIHHHPLVELIRSGLQVILTGFRHEHIFDYLKTDLTGLRRNLVDRLENYCLAHGTQPERWTTPQQCPANENIENADDMVPMTTQQFACYRNQAIGPLLNMRDKLGGENSSGQDEFSVQHITISLMQLLDELDAGRKLYQWYQNALAENDLDQAQVHKQIYPDIINLLEEIVEALGDIKLTISQYSDILLSALEEMTLPLIPPALDQVLVGTIERSRQPDVRAAFILGVNEGKFPQAPASEAFFTDSQRQQLQENDFELAPTSTEKLLHERYLGYIALTRAKEMLWVSYPIADEQTNLLNPSSLIGSILQAVDGITIIPISDEQNHTDLDNIHTVSQLGQMLAFSFATPNYDKTREPVRDEIYRYALARADWSTTIKQCLGGIYWDNTARLDQRIVDEILSKAMVSSVSQLESFAACPFKYFSRYVLKLQERDELKMTLLDVGSLYHKGLYHIFNIMQRNGINWDSLNEKNIEPIMEQVTKKLAGDVTALKQQSYRNRYIINQAMEQLRRLCHGLSQACRAGNFRQQHAELEFGPDKDIAALEINLPGEKSFRLRGVVDRIDTATDNNNHLGLVVFDYKSSETTFPFAKFYHGLSLQLVSYLLTLQKNYHCPDELNKTPAAALYLPIRRSGKPQSGPPPAEILNRQQNAEYPVHKANGLINADWAEALDGTLEPVQYSQYYGLYKNKDNSLQNKLSSSLVTDRQMQAILAHCYKVLTQLAGDIVHGEIPVRPYRIKNNDTACNFCEYQSFCRFDPGSDNYRELFSYTKEQVLTLIEQEYS
jgi:ATP-dependent helicase/nuclease subunit B